MLISKCSVLFQSIHRKGAKKLNNNNKFGISIWQFCLCRCSFLARGGSQDSSGDWWTEEHRRATLSLSLKANKCEFKGNSVWYFYKTNTFFLDKPWYWEWFVPLDINIIPIILVLPCKPVMCNTGKQIPSETGAERSIQTVIPDSILLVQCLDAITRKHHTSLQVEQMHRLPRGWIKRLRTGNLEALLHISLTCILAPSSPSLCVSSLVT